MIQSASWRRWPGIGIAVGLCLLAPACAAEEGEPLVLASGAQVRLTNNLRMDDGMSFVDYCTRLSLADRPALGAEADIVWEKVRAGAVHSDSTQAQVWPTICGWHFRWSGWFPVVVGSESTAFHYTRPPAGAWSRQ